MKIQTLPCSIVDEIKTFLLRQDKQVYDMGKRIYYVDYNGYPHRLKRLEVTK